MPLLLAFDTATPHLAVVLSDGARPVAWRIDPGPKPSHAEKINVYIGEVLAEAGKTMGALEAVAVGTGPGSYTGLRIGLSAAKGLAFALDRPLIGMGTLEVLLAEALGHAAPDARAVYWPMVDARRMEVYTRPYMADGQPLGATAPLVLDEAWCEARRARGGTVVVFGDGADKAAALWQAHPWITHLGGIRPGAGGLARCAGRYFREGRFSNLAHLVPEYGKPANVAQQRGKE